MRTIDKHWTSTTYIQETHSWRPSKTFDFYDKTRSRSDDLRVQVQANALKVCWKGWRAPKSSRKPVKRLLMRPTALQTKNC